MNAKWMTLMGLLAALSVPLAVRAEDPIPVPDTEGPFLGDVGGYSDGGPVATEFGSNIYGLGAFAHGMGEYNLSTARALHELQRARARAIQNHKLAVETRFDLQRQNRQARADELDPLTEDQLSRAIEAQRPDRLTIAQYNPVTGSLDWPVALHGKSFESEREALEYAFSSRTSRDSGPGSAFYSQVRRTTQQMLAKLRDKVDLYSPNEFGAARRFLEGLRYEALSPADVSGLAMR